MKKYSKMPFVLILLFLILFPIILNFFFYLTNIISGKKTNFLSIIYSCVGNEEWLGYWGNVISGILPLIIILYYREENEKQQRQFNKQLEFQYKQLKLQEEQQYQVILITKIKEEEKIMKEVLKLWDNSVFDNFFDIIIKYYKYLFFEKDNNEKELRNRQLSFLDDYAREKNKIIANFNYGMLEIDLLPLRINNTGENLQDSPAQVINYYKLKKECYNSFEELHDKVSEEFFKKIFGKLSTSFNLNEEEIKKLCKEFEKNRNNFLVDYSKSYLKIINSVSMYLYFSNEIIQNKNFEVFKDKFFSKNDRL